MDELRLLKRFKSKFDVFSCIWHSILSISNEKIRIPTQREPLSICRLDFLVRHPNLPLETWCCQWSSESKDPVWANLSVSDISVGEHAHYFLAPKCDSFASLLIFHADHEKVNWFENNCSFVVITFKPKHDWREEFLLDVVRNHPLGEKLNIQYSPGRLKNSILAGLKVETGK